MNGEPVEIAAEGANGAPRTAGVLRLSGASRAAVVILGNAAGDERSEAYAAALAEVGVSSLTVAAGSPRDLTRPSHDSDAFATAFGAFRVLTARPEIDALRIGVIGFSASAALAMLSATRAVARRYLRNGERFAAHAAVHPVTRRFNRLDGFEFRDLTGAPILLQWGADDDYESPDSAASLMTALDAFDRDSLDVIVHAGARHDFDRAPPFADGIDDPLSRAAEGGRVRLDAHAAAARAARAAAAAFFRDRLLRG